LVDWQCVQGRQFHPLHRGFDTTQGMAAQRDFVRGENQTQRLRLAVAFEFRKGELVVGISSVLSGDSSMRTARACGSFAQHSGDFVFMCLCELMVKAMAAGLFQPDKVVSGPATKPKEVAMQPVPKVNDAARREAGCQFHGQGTMAGAGDVLTQLLLVRGKYADAAPAARNGHIPLLRVRGGFDC
jgi:hypothetical protein